MRITTTLTTTTINGTETITNSFNGTLQQQGALTLLTYDDPELGATRIFITEDRVRIVRKGAFTTQMVLLPNATTHSPYHTPSGTFDLGIHTTLLHHNLTPISGTLTAHYTLFLNGEEVAQNELRVKWAKL
ncbi:MAG: DUF1934 domain-containing protein [Bacteroidaceae bacterium]|nr:DUF1934 domain-containing protein [Bacteroidaceae bacterium]